MMPEKANPGALAGATGAKAFRKRAVLSEYPKQGDTATPPTMKARISRLRRFGLADTLASAVAPLAFGEGRADG
jgi:hypothetical protein